MRKALTFVYGVLVYLFFLAVFLYSIGFVENLFVPKTLDAGGSPIPGPPFLVDLAVLGLFALQHSGMARRGFKDRWTRIVSPHLERSTYVLAASLCLAAVMWVWKPLSGSVWNIENPAAVRGLRAVSFLGWGMVLLATFLIDHFRLFGLKQVWARVRERKAEPPVFQTPFLYRWVRHPLYLGFLLAFWAAPRMSVAHLFFAALTTAWMLLAIRLEERDLVRFHGSAYEQYRERVRMLLPIPRVGSRRAGKQEPRPAGRKELQEAG